MIQHNANTLKHPGWMYSACPEHSGATKICKSFSCSEHYCKS